MRRSHPVASEGETAAVRLGAAAVPDAVFPSGSARSILTVPMLVRNRLRGVALYGAHASGSNVDADESKSLELLVAAAATAYDHVEAEALRTRVEELTEALAAAGLALDARPATPIGYAYLAGRVADPRPDANSHGRRG